MIITIITIIIVIMIIIIIIIIIRVVVGILRNNNLMSGMGDSSARRMQPKGVCRQ